MLKYAAKLIMETWPVATALDVVDRYSANRMTELGMISQAFQFAAINNVGGDYMEFGLWQGKTFCFAHRMKRRFRFNGMMLWGFDSFAGLPDVTDEQDNVWQTGEFSCSEQQFRNILKRRGVRPDEYSLVPGFYAESLNDDLHQRLKGRKAAIVYIDCDLYISTIQVLRFLPQYLSNGTIICFDDYYSYKGAPDQGEQRAIGEFLAAYPQFQFLPYFDYCPVGKSFIVRITERNNV